MTVQEIVTVYFASEEQGDVEAIVALCANDVIVRNAAQPPQIGKEGVRQYVTNFRDRTFRRQFDVLAVAEGDGVIFAGWKANLEFREGVSFGPVTTRRPFEIELHGICRFHLDEERKIRELDVFHETTSAFHLAQQAST